MWEKWLDSQLKNDEQRKSIAKTFHDISKALYIAALFESITKGAINWSIIKLLSVAIACVAVGLFVEIKIGVKEEDNNE